MHVLADVSLDIPERRPPRGSRRGRVVFTGTPADLVATAETPTAQHLRTYVAAEQDG